MHVEAQNGLIPMLNKGADALNEFGKEAEEMGYVLDNATVAAGKELNKNLKYTEKRIEGLKLQIGSAFIPTLNAFLDKVNSVAEKIFEWANISSDSCINTMSRLTTMHLKGL